MGQEALIFFKYIGEDPGSVVLSGWIDDCAKIEKVYDPSWMDIDATHEIELVNNNRYYGKSYGRGKFHEISKVIITLMASPNVEKVWYGPDSYDPDPSWLMSREKYLEILDYYLEHANSEYFLDFECKH